MFRFRLRTLLIAVAVLAVIGVVWIGYSLRRIAERREFLSDMMNGPHHVSIKPGSFFSSPSGLWMLGEPGVVKLGILGDGAAVERARALFPEAEVVELRQAPMLGQPDF